MEDGRREGGEDESLGPVSKAISLMASARTALVQAL